MANQEAGEYILGIDLGSNSLGWAVVGLVDDVPSQLIKQGARVFEAGVTIDPKSGRENTLNAQRRDDRQQRRQLWRHRRRLVKVAHILWRAGLLREGNLSDPEARQKFFNDLDTELRGRDLDAKIQASAWLVAKYPLCGIPKENRTKQQNVEVHRLKQLLPYLLRAAALEEELEPHFLGRAIFHLAQRRGFWSNRKTSAKKDEKPGEVEQDIRTLRNEMRDQTLGQYFSSLSPFERRIRDRWTSRDMYQTEFKAIWGKQAQHHPDLLTEEWRRLLYDAIFDQRPIKLKRSLVGQCEFEPSQRRAPRYLLISQRFRLLQVVNNLKVRPPGGEERTLTREERATLISALERRSDMKFKEVREHLVGITRRHSINLQRDKDEAKMPGNDTSAQLASVFGEQWFQFSHEKQDKVVADAQSILSVQDADQRRSRARKYLQNRGVENLDEACERFLGLAFEAGYRNLSIVAMKRFMPLLERGFQYGALSPHYRYLGEVTSELIRLAEAGVSHDKACEQLLTRKPEPITPFEFLPPVLSEEVQKRIGVIRNPIVTRSLTELRKVVNALVGEFGKPTRIHIELLRELKKPKDVREKIWKENLTREKRNETIEKTIRNAADQIGPITPKDIEKYRLWQESERCPYCLKPMTPGRLFGDDSEYQIDHIIPFSRSLDDSFVNKVLCHTDCNRSKGQMTPFEKYGRDPERQEHYAAILQCVSHFKGDARDEKLRRFKMDDKALE
ncbi:MAG: type II CRISPR RNA-guided endonuclease Cas9, partial [Candidatus Micrarchaeaceae archaeon]